jgi:hypothetical protein
MTEQFDPGFGLTARDCSRHRAGFPSQLVQRLAATGPERPASTCSASEPAAWPACSRRQVSH